MSKRPVSPNAAKRRGFTLVELVVVVLVLGIVAAVAAPKMFDTAGDARRKSTEQTLSVLRAAVESYYARNSAYPGEAGTADDLKADLEPYLRGAFPKNQVPGATGDGSVTVTTDGSKLTAGGAGDWKYDNQTGQLIINSTGFDTL